MTNLSAFWFERMKQQLPELHTHFLHIGLPSSITNDVSKDLISEYAPRSMVVRRCEVFPIESIVRGYLTGSAWTSYRKDGTVHGIRLPKGLQESEKLPQPIWTPSTKAEKGAKDENISPDEGKPHIHIITHTTMDKRSKAQQAKTNFRGI